MELKNITAMTMDAAIRFSFEKCSAGNPRSYPLYETVEEIEKEFKRSIDETNRELIGCYSNDILVGVFCFFYLPSDNYLQTTGIYIGKGNEESIALFLDYIENHYNHYSALIGVEPTYKAAMSTLSQFGYELVDNSIDFRLDMKKKIELCPIGLEKVKKIDESDFEQYLKFHRDYIDNEAGYWTSERISEHRDEWNIYVIYENSTIVSAIYCRYGNSLAEVFGDYTKSHTHPAMLLKYATIDLKQKYPEIECFMMMIEVDDTDFMKAAQEVGFEEKSRYCCWQKDL